MILWSRIRYGWWTQLSRWILLSGRAGAGITTMVTESVKTAHLIKAGVGDGRGLCSPESAGITNLPPAATFAASSARWKGFATPAGLAARADLGSARPCLSSCFVLAARPAPRCPLCGRMRSISSCCVPLATASVFDLIPQVAQHFQDARPEPPEIWKFNRQVRSIPPGRVLRIQAESAFRLHWTLDEWRHSADRPSTPTALGMDFVDISIPLRQAAPLRFTFFWTADGRWEGRDFHVDVAGSVVPNGLKEEKYRAS